VTFQLLNSNASPVPFLIFIKTTDSLLL